MMTLGGKLIAVHFGFNWAGTAYYYKPAYDPDYAKYSPGKLLQAYVIKRALDEKYNEFDMLNGLEPYKMNYTSTVHNTFRITAYPSVFRKFMERGAGTTEHQTA